MKWLVFGLRPSRTCPVSVSRSDRAVSGFLEPVGPSKGRRRRATDPAKRAAIDGTVSRLLRLAAYPDQGPVAGPAVPGTRRRRGGDFAPPVQACPACPGLTDGGRSLLPGGQRFGPAPTGAESAPAEPTPAPAARPHPRRRRPSAVFGIAIGPGGKALLDGRDMPAGRFRQRRQRYRRGRGGDQEAAGATEEDDEPAAPKPNADPRDRSRSASPIRKRQLGLDKTGGIRPCSTFSSPVISTAFFHPPGHDVFAAGQRRQLLGPTLERTQEPERPDAGSRLER